MPQTHEQLTNDILQCLTNISAHLHMVNGWFDAAWPYRNIICLHDRRLSTQMLNTHGQVKLAIRAISKELIRDDDKAIDYMFESIGAAVSSMQKLSIGEREVFTGKLNALIAEALGVALHHQG